MIVLCRLSGDSIEWSVCMVVLWICLRAFGLLVAIT